MFKITDVLIDAFVQSLDDGYREAFPEGEPGHRQVLAQVARMALNRMKFTNAMYFNLETAMRTAQVAEDVLHGRVIERGDVSSQEWVHFLAAALCHLIGGTRGCLAGDAGRICTVDEAGGTIELPRDRTDSALLPHVCERSQLFARIRYQQHWLLDGDRVADMIAGTGFPPPEHVPHRDISWASLLRGAQLVAMLSDPAFVQRQNALYIQLDEAGIAEDMGLCSVVDVRNSFSHRFFSELVPLMEGAIRFLKYTGDGQHWLAAMNSHMLQEEHRERV